MLLGVGPGDEREAGPRVQLVLCQAALHERELDRLNHALAVGIGRPQASPGGRLGFHRFCGHRRLPGSATQAQRNPLATVKSLSPACLSLPPGAGGARTHDLRSALSSELA